MPAVRYVGSAAWTRTIVNDEDKIVKTEIIQPGETVELSEEAAMAFADPAKPRGNRTFVMANGPEDPYKDDYEDPQWDSSNPQATNLPKLDMGSTRPGGEPQFELTAEQKAINERQAKGAAKRAELEDETPNADPKQQTPKPKDDGK